uniref:Uncharacterized protein n=1 Tax=Picea glauca TaxID=3330 RepID=A0A101LY23_PICGL|nr:hypothetical protein ABT39_MTgene5665 [Picea glauca]
MRTSTPRRDVLTYNQPQYQALTEGTLLLRYNSYMYLRSQRSQ